MTLDPVLNRFPERRKEIEARYQADGAFREICDDYCEVSGALVSQRAVLGPSELEAFKQLLGELEKELTAALLGIRPHRASTDEEGRCGAGQACRRR